jgi:hypothetical protein
LKIGLRQQHMPRCDELLQRATLSNVQGNERPLEGCRRDGTVFLRRDDVIEKFGDEKATRLDAIDGLRTTTIEEPNFRFFQ